MKYKSHQEENCDCSFCKIVSKYPKDHFFKILIELLHENGYDPDYIFKWNMPNWYKETDIEDPSILYFLLLPAMCEKFNLDVTDYIVKIPELKEWMLNAPPEQLNSIFGE